MRWALPRGRTSLLLGLLLMADPSASELRLSPLLSDGMVLQRDAIVPLWGVAEPDIEIEVTFRGQSLGTRAEADGSWRVELGPTAPGGPFEISIRAGSVSRVLRDILVGDVWVCSGQSNMEWVVADSLNAAAEIALARDSAIRHFKVPRSWSLTPGEVLTGGAWEPADPDHVGDFTAIGYFFARQLRRDLEIPLGLINTTWGGSRIEAWMSAESLGMDENGMLQALAAEREYEREVRALITERVGEARDQDVGWREGRAVWADPDLDDSDWEEMAVPSGWEEAGYPGMDGIGWYRISFELTTAESRAPVRLGLGAIDDSDISWVNGHEVGRTEMAWNRARQYVVPPEILRPGRNVIAVRVEDTGGGGGIKGDPGLLFLEVAGIRRSLARSWKFAVGSFTINLEDHKRQVPTVLFNQMVHPLQRFPVRGVLWYQGESNGDALEDALAYGDLFSSMIRDWRAGWREAELPFLWVQLANFMAPPTEPADSIWAVLRESQSRALALPGTAQVVTVDVGEEHDIHPTNKQAVGHRLALAARAVAYQHEVVYSGPAYRSHRVENGRVVISFHHVGGGLVAKDAAGPWLRGFAVAGEDGRFVWARAAIDGDKVVVWSPSVSEPVAVRYAWADNPEGANLYNRSGLPASPFRTDSW